MLVQKNVLLSKDEVKKRKNVLIVISLRTTLYGREENMTRQRNTISAL